MHPGQRPGQPSGPPAGSLRQRVIRCGDSRRRTPGRCRAATASGRHLAADFDRSGPGHGLRRVGPGLRSGPGQPTPCPPARARSRRAGTGPAGRPDPVRPASRPRFLACESRNPLYARRRRALPRPAKVPLSRRGGFPFNAPRETSSRSRLPSSFLPTFFSLSIAAQCDQEGFQAAPKRKPAGLAVAFSPQEAP